MVQGSGYLSNITSVIDKIRSLIGGGYGKPPYIWWNEGVIGPWGVALDPGYITRWKQWPRNVDFVSVDYYWDNGTLEFTQTWKLFEEHLFPKMLSHHQVLLNPGIFASTPEWCLKQNMSLHFPDAPCPWTPGCPKHAQICSLEAQEQQVVDKLELFFQKAKVDTRIAG